MTRHCPKCSSTNITTTLMATDNDAFCACGWEGKEDELRVEKTFADEFMERLRAPPIRNLPESNFHKDDR